MRTIYKLAEELRNNEEIQEDEEPIELPDFSNYVTNDAETGERRPLTFEEIEESKAEFIEEVKKFRQDTKSLEGGGEVIAYHGGRDFEGNFSLNFVGSGEGLAAQGPGIYFATNKNVAKLYCKYVEPSALYTVKLRTDGLYRPYTGHPQELGDKLGVLMDEMKRKLGKEPFYFNTFLSTLGPKKAREELINIGINGMYTHLPNDSYEISVYNPNIITILDKEEC